MQTASAAWIEAAPLPRLTIIPVGAPLLPRDGERLPASITAGLHLRTTAPIKNVDYCRPMHGCLLPVWVFSCVCRHLPTKAPAPTILGGGGGDYANIRDSMPLHGASPSLWRRHITAWACTPRFSPTYCFALFDATTAIDVVDEASPSPAAWDGLVCLAPWRRVAVFMGAQTQECADGMFHALWGVHARHDECGKGRAALASHPGCLSRTLPMLAWAQGAALLLIMVGTSSIMLYKRIDSDEVSRMYLSCCSGVLRRLAWPFAPGL